MNENEFAYRIRRALNEGAESLDAKTLQRLEQARKAALARYRGDASRPWMPALPAGRAKLLDFASAGTARWLNPIGVAVPLAALLVGFIAIQQWQHERHIDELANLDFSVLLDEAPIEAYADKAFGEVLRDDTI
ncbi:MAG TPA: DUF3619 family protein [Burkholderiaceae bacterium]|nr:DUF3619 family protein [Burkholderiaceae bacterium]